MFEHVHRSWRGSNLIKNLLNVDQSEIDVGFGKPMELSSKAGSYETTALLLPAGHGWVGDFSFHTQFQENPFVIIDLQSVRWISRLRVFNRDSLPDRAIPLVISTSLDRESWSELCRINYAFGGRVAGDPLDLIFRQRIDARYFKLQVLKSTFFHLDYVEILARLPILPLGRLQKFDTSGPSILAEYSHHHSYGFTWTFTITLKAIADCRAYGVTISNIDYSRCLAPFKERPDADAYRVLFAPEPISATFESLVPMVIDHHGVYASLNLPELKRYATLYFNPSAEAKAFEAQILRGYDLNPHNTMALVYRGTDKASEVPPTPIEEYISVALAARRRNPGLQVIIQTDQEQALQAVIGAIPDAIFFKELPTTSGATVLHDLPLEDQFKISKTGFAIRMLAVIHLLSSVKYVVTHTGNIGLWLACYRGHSEGFYQFDRDLKLRGPGGEVIDNPAALALQPA